MSRSKPQLVGGPAESFAEADLRGAQRRCAHLRGSDGQPLQLVLPVEVRREQKRLEDELPKLQPKDEAKPEP